MAVQWLALNRRVPFPCQCSAVIEVIDGGSSSEEEANLLLACAEHDKQFVTAAAKASVSAPRTGAVSEFPGPVQPEEVMVSDQGTSASLLAPVAGDPFPGPLPGVPSMRVGAATSSGASVAALSVETFESPVKRARSELVVAPGAPDGAGSSSEVAMSVQRPFVIDSALASILAQAQIDAIHQLPVEVGKRLSEHLLVRLASTSSNLQCQRLATDLIQFAQHAGPRELQERLARHRLPDTVVPPHRSWAGASGQREHKMSVDALRAPNRLPTWAKTQLGLSYGEKAQSEFQLMSKIPLEVSRAVLYLPSRLRAIFFEVLSVFGDKDLEAESRTILERLKQVPPSTDYLATYLSKCLSCRYPLLRALAHIWFS